MLFFFSESARVMVKYEMLGWYLSGRPIGLSLSLYRSVRHEEERVFHD